LLLDVTVGLAVAVNVAVVAPAGTTTEAGTVATAVFEDFRATVAPPVAAATDRVTVPVEVPPAWTEVGERVNPINVDICP